MLLMAMATLMTCVADSLVHDDSIPEDTAKRLGLDLGFYQKHLDADGIPILSSGKVDDHALDEVRYLIRSMLVGCDELRAAMAKEGIWVGVMAHDEFTTDMPETRHMSAWWDKRARGLGGNPVTCGEENLLNFKGDPYDGENIFIHEFAHAIHHTGLKAIDGEFDGKLREIYRKQEAGGMLSGYCMETPEELWAEGVQSWFDCNRDNILLRGPDGVVVPIRTRDDVRSHLPGLAGLLEEVFGGNPWRYTPASARDGEGHLVGFERSSAPVFAWPAEVLAAFEKEEARRKESTGERRTEE